MISMEVDSGNNKIVVGELGEIKKMEKKRFNISYPFEDKKLFLTYSEKENDMLSRVTVKFGDHTPIVSSVDGILHVPRNVLDKKFPSEIADITNETVDILVGKFINKGASEGIDLKANFNSYGNFCSYDIKPSITKKVCINDYAVISYVHSLSTFFVESTKNSKFFPRKLKFIQNNKGKRTWCLKIVSGTERTCLNDILKDRDEGDNSNNKTKAQVDLLCYIMNFAEKVKIINK